MTVSPAQIFENNGGLHGSISLLQFRQHLQQVVREDDAGVLLHLVRAEPGLVAAELVLLQRR